MTDKAALIAILELLDDMANRNATMGWDDIEDLCEAREIAATVLNFRYNEQTERYSDY